MTGWQCIRWAVYDIYPWVFSAGHAPAYRNFNAKNANSIPYPKPNSESNLTSNREILSLALYQVFKV